MESDEDLDLIDHFGVEDSDTSDRDTKQRKSNGDAVEYSESDGEDSAPLIIRRKEKSPKDLRDVIEDDPELWGIRRSHRPRKETSRFNVNHNHDKKISRKRQRSSSGSNNSSDEEWNSRKRHSYKDVKRSTRGNRVDYKEQFNDNLSEFSEEEKKPAKPKVALSSDRRRDGPLVRSYASIAPSEAVGSEEVDAIEDILNYRIGRIGATGDDTTFYSENDPNKDFKPDSEQGEMQYLIKWRGWSHLHNTWESDASLSTRNVPPSGLRKLDNYKQYLKMRQRIKKHASPEELETIVYEEEKQGEIREDKKKIDRIITHAKSKTDAYNDYYVKWQRLEYSESTWEDGKLILQYFGAAYDNYERRCKSDYIPKVHCEALRKRPKFIPLSHQPEYIGGSELTLRDYQLDGLNWMIRAWTRGNSVILADEMGLGKTIQTISFLSYLFYAQDIYGPFLLVVPLSTMSNWQSEFQKWAPEMNVIVYLGNTTSRQIIRDYEWYVGSKKCVKFNVCLSTYEIVRKDRTWLSSVKWAFLGVDEAHCLKNDASELYKTLVSFDANCRLLITGTPLQNSLRELWALLHFIMPLKFQRFEEFEQRFDMSNGSFTDVPNMHAVLQPFLLRRVKKDVEKSLPEKTELILRIDMSSAQKQMYKLILARNYEALNKGNTSKKSSFLNIVMELKKCCNHPRLIYTAEEADEFERKAIEEKLRTLIKSSGKMMALDKLLYRFKSNGNRVLIFSQMVRMLDLISDYMILRGWSFQRLDGSIQGELRKQAIEHFNAEGSTDFCFLLSTRAGGLGVNLATADTVIIFDSDWNPQNDLQAQARAHRIGQKKQVSVYRFVIKQSVEEKIIERAKQKMVLEHLVIQRMDARGNNSLAPSDFSKEELNAILRFGAEDLFKEDEANENDDVDIDDILKKAESRDVEAEAEKQNPASDLLKQFKFVEFDLQEDEDVVYVNKAGQAKSWSDIIPENVRSKVKEEEDQKKLLELELGPRKRQQRVDLGKKSSVNDQEDDNESSSSSSSDRKTRSFNDKTIRALVKTMRKFPRPLERVTDIITEAELPNESDAQVTELMKTIIEGCERVLAEPLKPGESEDGDKKGNRGPVFQLGKIPISARSVVQSMKDLDILHTVMPTTEELRRCFTLPFTPKIVSWDCSWEPDDDAKLLVGVFEKGMENWDAIKMDPSLGFTMKILPNLGNKRPQASHLRTRVDYLLKELRQRTYPSSDKLPSVERKSKSHEKKEPPQKKLTIKLPTNVKSDEFVNTSDSSDSSDDQDGGEKSKKTKSKSGPREDSQSNQASESATKSKKVKNKKSKPHRHLELTTELIRECRDYFTREKGLFKVLEQADEQRMKAPDVVDALLQIGHRIKKVLHAMEKDPARDIRMWREYLWQFVSQFTCMDIRSIHHIYKEMLKKQKRAKIEPKSSHHHSSSSSSHNHSKDKKRKSTGDQQASSHQHSSRPAAS